MLFFWKTTKQATLSLSSEGVEYIAIVHCTTQCSFIAQLLIEILNTKIYPHLFGWGYSIQYLLLNNNEKHLPQKNWLSVASFEIFKLLKSKRFLYKIRYNVWKTLYNLILFVIITMGKVRQFKYKI